MIDHYKRLTNHVWDLYINGSLYLVVIALSLKYITTQWEETKVLNEYHAKVLVDVLYNYDSLGIEKAKRKTYLETVEAYATQQPWAEKGEHEY